MAIFGATLISGQAPRGVFKAFCETQDDMDSPAAEAWLESSVIVCMNTDTEDKKPTGHVKLPDGSWTGRTGTQQEANDG